MAAAAPAVAAAANGSATAPAAAKPASASPAAARPRKHVVVGDIHGCLDELQRLLTKATGIQDFRNAAERAAAPIEWCPVHIGDVVGKGPQSQAVVQYLMDIGAPGVMGNHCHHVLMCADTLGLLPKRPLDMSVPATHRGPPYPGIGFFKADSEHAKLAAALTPAQLEYLRNLPLTLELPEYPDTILVHAGLKPPVKGGAADLATQLPDHCLNMRNLGSDGSVSFAAHAVDAVATPSADSKRAAAVTAEAAAAVAPVKVLPWAKVYAGPKQVIFGHDAVRGLQREPFALGLDTGCCYGKQLTCVILPDRTLVQVDAARVYSQPNIALTYRALAPADAVAPVAPPAPKPAATTALAIAAAPTAAAPTAAL